MAGVMKLEEISKDGLEVPENNSDDSNKSSLAENMNCKYMLNVQNYLKMNTKIVGLLLKFSRQIH
jgi:hypothetical protein